jgi:hypothetical protein
MPRSSSRLAFAVALLACMPLSDAAAQSLRGSRQSIERMYRQAHAERLPFHETDAGVHRAASTGGLVPLEPDANVALHRVGFPWVRPATRSFVQRLGAQYEAACGEALVVTSAVRPATRQPANATERSVHPTGMAVDFRKPRKPACLRWLRGTLLDLERAGVIEATEERRPAHFHVAVFPTPYTLHTTARGRAEATVTYIVRAGDTLWDIAREHETTVDALTSANRLDGMTVRPGQELRIPSGG